VSGAGSISGAALLPNPQGKAKEIRKVEELDDLTVKIRGKFWCF
jgi:hypothetical protein